MEGIVGGMIIPNLLNHIQNLLTINYLKTFQYKSRREKLIAFSFKDVCHKNVNKTWNNAIRVLKRYLTKISTPSFDKGRILFEFQQCNLSPYWFMNTGRTMTRTKNGMVGNQGFCLITHIFQIKRKWLIKWRMKRENAKESMQKWRRDLKTTHYLFCHTFYHLFMFMSIWRTRILDKSRNDTILMI